jgi:hypothetical protein
MPSSGLRPHRQRLPPALDIALATSFARGAHKGRPARYIDPRSNQ